jgi:hypothetical protein
MAALEHYSINIFRDLSTTDQDFASLLCYAGFPLIACTNDRPTKWTFSGVQKFDAEAYWAESVSAETTVLLRDYRLAEGLVRRVASMAKNSVVGFRSNTGWCVKSEERV